jgi:soluble lytic murein transglycosylase-like protein
MKGHGVLIALSVFLAVLALLPRPLQSGAEPAAEVTAVALDAACDQARRIAADILTLRTVPEDRALEIGRLVRDAVRVYGLESELLLAQIEVESGFDPLARGALGERGLLQISRPAFDEAGGTDFEDWRAQFWASVRYLAGLRDRRGGDMERALAAYNAGPSLRPEEARRRAAPYLKKVARRYQYLVWRGGSTNGPSSDGGGRNRRFAFGV